MIQIRPTTRDRIRPGETIACGVDGVKRTVGDCLASKCRDLLPSFGCRLEAPFTKREVRHGH